MAVIDGSIVASLANLNGFLGASGSNHSSGHDDRPGELAEHDRFEVECELEFEYCNEQYEHCNEQFAT